MTYKRRDLKLMKPHLVPSLKLERMVICRSHVARDYCHLLDRDPTVKNYTEDTEVYRVTLDGLVKSMAPDLMIQRTNGIELAFCRNSRYANQAWKEITAQIRCEYETTRCQIRVLTEKILNEDFLLRNVVFLTSYARLEPPPGLEGKVYEQLIRDKAPRPIRELAGEIGGSDRSSIEAVILYMLYWHRLEGTLKEQILTPMMTVHLPQTGGEL